MVTVSIVFNLQALYVVAAVLVSLFAYVLFLKGRDRRNRVAMHRVSDVASSYLRANGIDAHVTSYPVLGGRRFVVLVESMPSEKLRSSHVVELAVIEEVRKHTGFVVERVFWRFPIPVLSKDEIRDDLYLAQGFKSGLREAGYTVDEAPLEQFEHAFSQLKPGPPPAASSH